VEGLWKVVEGRQRERGQLQIRNVEKVGINRESSIGLQRGGWAGHEVRGKRPSSGPTGRCHFLGDSLFSFPQVTKTYLGRSHHPY
jgi:hypothetical protein